MARDLYEHTVHVKKSTFESQFKNELQTDGTRTNKLRCTVFTRPRGNPLCSKVLEKVVCDALLAHVLPSLPPSQHGFLPNRSCVSNLSVFLKYSWDSIQAGAQTDSIYTDYSSAFTSVNHILLIHKLKSSFNVTGRALSWFQSYLTDRRQRVVLDGQCSDCIPVRSGVPEGSVCGPLLFICFTADLPALIQTNCIMYADDIKLYHRINSQSDTHALQADLDRLSTWSATWRLKLNPAKCHTISFSLRKTPVLATYTLVAGGVTL